MQFETLDESRLSGENPDIYIFRWLNALEKHLKGLDTEGIKKEQKDLCETLAKIVTASELYPLPGRPIRHLVARCLVSIFTKGDARPLYDTLQSLVRFLADPKIIDKDVQKTASLHCVGECMEIFGNNVMSLMGDIVNVTIRLLRTSPTSVVRYHALLALRQSLNTARRAVPDPQARDLVKQLRSALNDKSLVVQRAACDVLVVMYPAEDSSRSTSEIESIVSSCTRALDAADLLTRGAHARLVGHLLASSQRVHLVPVTNPPKKTKKENEPEADDDDAGAEQTTEVAKALMKPEEMLSLLSVQIAKPNITRRTRVGIFAFYQALYAALGTEYIEGHYTLIVGHFMNDILASPKLATGPSFEVALTQKAIRIVMRDLIGARMLGEQAQIDAILELTNTYIRRWPALLPGQTAPSPLILSSTLEEIASLLQQVGNAPTNVQEALSEPLLGLLAHPQDAVRSRAAWALRCFCYVAPSRLPKALLTIMELIQRDVSVVATPNAPQDIAVRAVGHAYGLAAVVAVIRERPLYVSYDTTAKILDLAVQLLKRAGTHDTHIAAIEIEVAWTLLAALMTLGPNFVRSQLPQLLVLWRNALPKPTSKDSDANAGRTAAEWLFLLHVRENALGAIHSFLLHNSSSLVTLDVARRIASLLTNVFAFANAFISQTIDVSGAGDINASSLLSREAALRRRIYQCFSVLGFSGVSDSTQSALLQSAVAQFASPTGYIGSAMQAAIASSAGDMTSLSQCHDGYAYGVSSIQLVDLEGTTSVEVQQGQRERLNRDAVENALDNASTLPVLQSMEHDSLLVCTTLHTTTELRFVESSPAPTGVVDAAIQLFGALLTHQGVNTCASTLQQLLELLRSPKLERNNGRRLAVTTNSTIAIVAALRDATSRRSSKEVVGHPTVVSTLYPLLLDTLVDSDSVVRSLASEAIGRLASCANTAALSTMIKDLVDRVVNNRDPHARAGYALSFGMIFMHVGGLAGGALLKTTVNVLMSLSQDPHPVVHYWALSALSHVINAASLGFAPYVTSTLNMVFRVYASDVHEPEGGSLHNSNLRGDLPSYQVLCRIMDALVNVLGPDLQESSNTQGLVLEMVHELFLESDEGVRVEAIKTMQHLLMFAADQVTIPELVLTFRAFLTSHRRLLKIASINALYQLVQRDALTMSKIGGDQLVAELFAMLDSDPTITGVRGVITNWLRQTAVLNPSAWIDVCQRIMSRSVASQTGGTEGKGGATQDDEAEGLNAGMSKNATSSGVQVTARWRTQLFSLECLHHICSLVAKSGRREHVDVIFARANNIPVTTLLVTRVADLIKMAFTASASHVTEIRLEGLVLLKDVVETFSQSPDPDFENALLLEQHQAPITAALTPAFSTESSPEILASAVEACAIFVGSGIIKDINKMGRILRLLTSSMEQATKPGTLSIGDAGELSPNASVMLRIATLTAWAKLEIARPSQPYLDAITGPHRLTLASLWIASLRDYAGIRADIEVTSQDTSMTALDSSSSGLGRDILLPYYADAWPVMLRAIAVLMNSDASDVLRAMDGLDASAALPSATRDEPTALFFVIFGLSFEALLSSSAEDSTQVASKQQNVKTALQVLKHLVEPAYSGKAFMQGPVFEEFIGLAYRMAMTDPADVQKLLIEVLANLVTSRPGKLPQVNDANEVFSASLPQTHCLKVVAFLTREAVSTSHRSRRHTASLADQASLVKAAFDALAALQSVFGDDAKDDLRAVAVALYHELLRDESTNVDIVEPTLPALKAILEPPVQPSAEYEKLLHGFFSGCLVSIDEMRGREGILSSKKIKNNMLAAVLTLSAGRQDIRFSRSTIERLCAILTSKLLEDSELSLIAAQCIRTIVTSAISGNVNLRGCIRDFLPDQVEYMGKIASIATEGLLAHVPATGTEVVRTWALILSSTSDAHQSSLLGIFLPVLALFLDDAQAPSNPLHVVALSQVLNFASSNASPFREAIGKLDAPTRDILETSIRSALGKQASTHSQTSAKPQISLRAF